MARMDAPLVRLDTAGSLHNTSQRRKHYRNLSQAGAELAQRVAAAQTRAVSTQEG
jgi:hypothetical protein